MVQRQSGQGQINVIARAPLPLADSLAQICHHCALAMHATIDGFTFKPPLMFRLLKRLIMPGIKSKLFRTRQIKPGLPAPPPFNEPEAGADAEPDADSDTDDAPEAPRDGDAQEPAAADGPAAEVDHGQM